MSEAITLVITSCARHDLLECSLRSFDKFNTHPIEATVIVEDGELPAPAWLEALPNLGPKTWIANGKRKGQIYSIDRAYAEVKTPYIFHCEDDWEFFRRGFIEESAAILDRYPNIVQCSLREDWGHPSVTIQNFPFPINEPDWREGWSGFCFNPGLRRLADYQRIGSYGRIVGYDPSFVGELALSKLYRDAGFYAAALPAACKHIGAGNRHISWQTAPKAPRVLIAIPACHKYDYESHADNSIHQSNASNARIEAVRATWQGYLAAFKSYVELRFFYGQPMADRQPLDDEVFLDVPDAYDSLPVKVQAIYQWALQQRFDFVFKTDDDTFVYLDRLLASGFENYDYLGYCSGDQHLPLKDRYASGGSGYWLSSKAMGLVTQAKVDDWAEDRWVGKVLFSRGIKVTRDTRYLPGFDRHNVDIDALPEPNSYISFHACSPKAMADLYARKANPTFQCLTVALNEPRCAAMHQGMDFWPKENVQHIRLAQRTANGLRVLIAITSCHRRAHLREMQRETWIMDIHRNGADYRFFLGMPSVSQQHDPRRGWLSEYGNRETAQPLRDEIFLNVTDSYEALPLKTQALLRWAYEQGYDFVFKCDDDTYCCVDRLLVSGFEGQLYSGFQKESDYFGPGLRYAQGGAGYWLSRQAMAEVLADDSVSSGPEDINVARILRQRGIALFHDLRYRPDMLWPSSSNDFITAHRCTPEEMLKIHTNFVVPSPASSTELVEKTNRQGMERVMACESPARDACGNNPSL